MFSTASASCQPMSSLSTSSSSRIDLFVLCSRHVTPSIFRQHHISKASILFLSDFLIVHPSAPCRNTAHTICFMTLTFSTLLMLLSFQILVSSVAFCRASAARIFMSFVQLNLLLLSCMIPETWSFVLVPTAALHDSLPAARPLVYWPPLPLF